MNKEDDGVFKGFTAEADRFLHDIRFKATHGKRLFKMAPIHHHFEKSGWSETRIVAVFMVMTFLLCFVGILAL